MKPVSFRYERPVSVEEAGALLREHGDEAKVLAGGQSLVPMLNMRLARPSVLVDINRLPLGEIARENGSWRVGATVRQADRRLLEIPLLADCLPHVGHFVTRNRGTVGGSIAHADAAAELPLALTALAGSVVTRDVADHALVFGNPARLAGYVCRCGKRLVTESGNTTCAVCGTQNSIPALESAR